MFKPIFIALLPFLAFFGNNTAKLTAPVQNPDGNTGVFEKMAVDNGTVTMDLNMAQIGVANRTKGSTPSSLRFEIRPDSMFSVVVFNNEFRGPLPSSMELNPMSMAKLPGRLDASYQNLILESMPYGGHSDLTVRDGKTGFVFFNVDGYEYNFDSNERSLDMQSGRLVISKDFATELGRPALAGTPVGNIHIRASMRSVEVSYVQNGEVQHETLPANGPEAGTRPGPDVVVGDLSGLAQFGGSANNQVGLAIGTDSCNYGTVDLRWDANPSNDHPVIPQNLYRQSGGPNNNDRFEQVSQSSVKHAFTALTQNLCGLGCNGVGNNRLGSGCSDPYSASLNAGNNNALGSRAWINPFTGAFPRNDGQTPNNSHQGHSHSGPTHRMLTNISDLSTTQNAGATYFAEGQYITPHEYVHCQSNPTQCNMNNNVSYRQYSVNGTGSPFTFSPVAPTVREKPAIAAWAGASSVEFRPDPNDGIGTVAYKVTNPSPGVWRYEYAVYNQNIDRAIREFSVPVGAGATLSNVGFSAPPQHPGSAMDGTFNNAGFSTTAWAQSQAGGAMTWSAETLAQNQNSNAIRWGTLYNFRFESNRPPQAVNATLGFLKTGSPITVAVQGPSPVVSTGPFSIQGRVTRSTNGQPIGGIYVFLIDSNSIIRSAVTNQFGFYTLDDVIGGQTYTFGTSSKRFDFPLPTMVQINNSLTDQDFQGVPLGE